MGTKNKIEDVRNHLFAQLERLNDDKEMQNPLKLEKELKKASEIAKVAKVIVESAKVEVMYIKAVESIKGTGFIPIEGTAPKKQIEDYEPKQ